MPAQKFGLELEVYVTESIELSFGGTFSPTTATIIIGPTEAVLVDTLYAKDDVDALADVIAATGKTLTTIFITHAHFDHYFGLGKLLERFPTARGVAMPAVVDAVHQVVEQDKATAEAWMPGKVVDPSALPKALIGPIVLDGHELHAIDLGQGDCKHSTVLHVPSLDAVVAGDVLYNGVHQMLGTSTPADWPRWISSIDKIEALNPRIVVAGHKQPHLPDNDVASILNGTRQYIAAFIESYESAKDANEVIATMSERFPNRINPATLHYSAATAMEAKGTPTN